MVRGKGITRPCLGHLGWRAVLMRATPPPNPSITATGTREQRMSSRVGADVGRRVRAERGATVVELAVALPILLMLVFGMVTAGLGLFDKVSLNAGAREASRFGATYPEEDAASPDDWFVDVASVAQTAATGSLGEGVSGRSICVARGVEGGSTRRYIVATSDPIGAGTFGDTWCPLGGPALPPGSGHEAVQIVLERDIDIELIFFSLTPHMVSDSTTRYER